MNTRMNTRLMSRLILISLFLGGIFLAIPSKSEAYEIKPWIDKIVLEVEAQQALTKQGNFEPYLKQLELTSEASAKGDFVAKRKLMSRFLEMLETKEGGISQDAAHRIFRTVVKVTPNAILVPVKDKSKLDPEEKALVNRIEQYASDVRNMEDRASRSF